jgi:nucleoside-diphosphate-sugar epimerase
MKIFLLGSTGFIGKHLKEYFDAKGDEVICACRPVDIGQDLTKYQPDVIINCAGEVYNQNLMFGANLLVVEQILRWLKDNPRQAKFIQLGSSSEYGVLNHPSSEINDRINPIDIYQATKGAATLLVQGYARTYNLDAVVVRLYSVYGLHERENRLMPKLFQAFEHNRDMYVYKGAHDWIAVGDVVRGIDILVGHKHLPPGDIINFGTGICTTNLKLLVIWEQETSKRLPGYYVDTYSKPYDSEFWEADTNYAYAAYGFKAEIPLVLGVKNYIKEKKGVDYFART